MSVKEEEIKKLEALSNLVFSEKEKEEMLSDLNKITEFVGKIKKFEITKGKTFQRSVKINELREDIVGQSMEVTKILGNAPETEHSSFSVPKVVE